MNAHKQVTGQNFIVPICLFDILQSDARDSWTPILRSGMRDDDPLYYQSIVNRDNSAKKSGHKIVALFIQMKLYGDLKNRSRAQFVTGKRIILNCWSFSCDVKFVCIIYSHWKYSSNCRRNQVAKRLEAAFDRSINGHKESNSATVTRSHTHNQLEQTKSWKPVTHTKSTRKLSILHV